MWLRHAFAVANANANKISSLINYAMSMDVYEIMKLSTKSMKDSAICPMEDMICVIITE